MDERVGTFTRVIIARCCSTLTDGLAVIRADGIRMDGCVVADSAEFVVSFVVFVVSVECVAAIDAVVAVVVVIIDIPFDTAEGGTCSDVERSTVGLFRLL